MRRFALILGSIAILAACSPSAPTAEAPAAGAAFPDLGQAAYRAEGRIMREGQSVPIVMIRDGANFRMEISIDQGQTVIIRNGQTGESYSIVNAAGRTMALRMSNDAISDPNAGWDAADTATMTNTGNCSGAGLSGTEWTRTDADGAVSTGCVTQNGILLRATKNGETVWETTSVQAGPQSPDLFQLPPGVQVMDMNNIRGMAEAMRGGQ
ncbi:MAG: hypothetical protein K2P58_12240 [Hyphomonadaceae bacterium]|nr:hypothetical protein [Hyphomonadaceae bacterium]